MRILFAGTPEIALPSLRRLSIDYEVAGVLTNPDRGSGRGRGVVSCPVKLEADNLGLKTFQPEKLDAAFIEEVKALKPDLLAVVAYGKIFKKDFIDIFPYGGLNVHPSLLPRYRGASPIQSALLSGDSETGISIQRLALKMDSGAVLRQETYVYKGDETGESLTGYFAERGAVLLSEVIGGLKNGTVTEAAQNDEEATYCTYINKDDGHVDWNETAADIERKLRAFTPWPGIFTYFADKKLNILNASVYTGMSVSDSVSTVPGKVCGIDRAEGILIQTGEGILAVSKLQLQSKKVLDWKSFLNGVKDFSEAVLGG